MDDDEEPIACRVQDRARDLATLRSIEERASTCGAKDEEPGNARAGLEGDEGPDGLEVDRPILTARGQECGEDTAREPSS